MKVQDPNYQLIARRIKEKRKEMKMTQEKLAEHVDVSVKFIGLVEAGYRKAGFKSLFRIASALGSTLDALTLEK